MRCPGCGADNQAKFCRACGLALSAAPADATAASPAQKSCAHCGKTCKAEAKFCPHCGKGFGMPAAQAAAPDNEVSHPHQTPATAPAASRKLPAGLLAAIAAVFIGGAIYGIHAWRSTPEATADITPQAEVSASLPEDPAVTQSQAPTPQKNLPAASTPSTKTAPAAQTKPLADPQPPTAAPPVNTAPQWLLTLRRELEQCNRKGGLAASLCAEGARLQYCFPDRWGSVPECPKTEQPAEQ